MSEPEPHSPSPERGVQAARDGPSRRRRSRARRTAYALLTPLLRWMILALGRSWRLRGDIHGAGGPTRLEQALRQGPVVLALYHEQVVPAALHLLQCFARARRPLVFLVSPSVDGDLTTGILEGAGAVVSRGSATRSGIRALRGLHRKLAGEGASPLIAVDGPQGPPHRPKPGVVLLAQLARAPLVPLALVPRRAWRLPTWDRLLLPLPFTRLAVAIGAPRHVPAELSGADLEVLRGALEVELEDLVRRATELART